MEQRQELQQEAIAADLQILDRYKGKQVVMEVDFRNFAISGCLAEVGQEFVHLTACKHYEDDINSFVELPHYADERLNNYGSMPDMTISRSQIRRIVLLEDLVKQAGQPAGARK